MRRFTSALSTWLLPCALALASLYCAHAHAQVAVLRVDPAAEGLCAALEGAIADMQLVRDPGYLNEAWNQRLDPSADSTLELIIPLLGLRLAVVPQSADDRSVQVELRDGRSGAILGVAAIPLDNGLLGFVGRHALRREVGKRLAGEPPAVSGGPPMTGGGEISSDEAGGGTEQEQAPSDGKKLAVDVFAGLGFGMRELEWPSNGERLRVETGMFAAYEVAARFAFPVGESTTFGPELTYQSSLAHEVKESHLDAPDETIGIRAHRFAGALAATFLLGESGTFSIAPSIGYATRSLRPEVHHLLTPSYSLAGPVARLSLGIAFGDVVSLRVAPEAQYAFVGDELEERGVTASAISIGGEAALAASFSHAVALELTFREAHALLSAKEGDASDVERFVTTRLRWSP